MGDFMPCFLLCHVCMWHLSNCGVKGLMDILLDGILWSLCIVIDCFMDSKGGCPSSYGEASL